MPPPPPKTRSKPRFALFNVGKTKASPARAASTKRASLRQSGIRTEALKLPREFVDAEEPVRTRVQGGEASTSDPNDTQRATASQIPSRGDDIMKDTALPPLPNDRPAAALAHPSSGSAPGEGGASPRSRPEREPEPYRPSLSTDAGTVGQSDQYQQQQSHSPPLPPKSASQSSSRHPEQVQLQPSATTPTTAMNPHQPSRTHAPRAPPHLHVQIPPAHPHPQPQPQHMHMHAQRSQPHGHGHPANASANTGSSANLFKKFASKLRASTAPEPSSHPSSSSSTMPARPSHPPSHTHAQPQPPPQAQPQRTPQKNRSGLRTVLPSLPSLPLPALPKAPVPAAPPNDFTSREQRQAALRARGLLPSVPLSEQEAEWDRRVGVVQRGVGGEGAGTGGEGGESEARKIREAWLARNRELLVVEGREGEDGERRSSESQGERGTDTPTKTKSMDAKTNTAATVVATVVPLPAEPDSPSNSSAVTEKVSRWLQAATDGPTPLSTSAAASSVQQQQQQQSPLTESPRPSLTFSTSALTQDEKAAASPAGTVRAKPRKEKPPPIVVAAPGSVRGSPAKKDAVHAAHAVAVAVAVVAPSDSEGSTSDEGQHARGRPGHLQSQLQAQAQSQPHPPQLAHTDSSTSSGSGSRATTLPALSPTRTVSSSGAESTLPTPTTASCQRGDVSISHGSSSHSSDQSHGVRVSARRVPSANPSVNANAKARVGGIMQSSIEESFSESEERDVSAEGAQSTSIEEEEDGEDGGDSDEGEFGAGGMPAQTVPLAAVRPHARPQRVQTAEQAAEMQAGRKSFSLFGKRAATVDVSSSHNARGASSMSNLRRAFAGGFTAKLQVRPRSSIDPATSTSTSQHPHTKRSKYYDASHLPASPSYTQQQHHPPPPPSSFPGMGAGGGGLAVPLQGRTTGVGLRPRQPVAPTMHSRGSILHQAHFIEDDESRRLSEMAFLT